MFHGAQTPKTKMLNLQKWGLVQMNVPVFQGGDVSLGGIPVGAQPAVRIFGKWSLLVMITGTFCEPPQNPLLGREVQSDSWFLNVRGNHICNIVILPWAEARL